MNAPYSNDWVKHPRWRQIGTLGDLWNPAKPNDLWYHLKANPLPQQLHENCHCADHFPIKRLKIDADASFLSGAHHSFTIKSYHPCHLLRQSPALAKKWLHKSRNCIHCINIRWVIQVRLTACIWQPAKIFYNTFQTLLIIPFFFDAPRPPRLFLNTVQRAAMEGIPIRDDMSSWGKG